MLSKAQAIEIANAECERRELPLLDPVKVTRGPFRIVVLGHSTFRGGNTRVTLHARTGAVLRVGFNPR